MKVEKEIFGNSNDGKEVFLFTIINENGSQLCLTNFGAAVVDLKVPDKNGHIESVILGFDNFKQYEEIRGFYGATVGRYGNRIDRGVFKLNGIEYILPTNEGSNHLHGGDIGFDRVVWNYEVYDNTSPSVSFFYMSKDGEQGYPGNFKVSVTYSFTHSDELIISYEMSSDKPTIKNVTNHSYFNLSGNMKESILGHTLLISGDRFLAINKNLIPTGEFLDVVGTPMDFTIHKKIGKDINNEYKQLELGLGYDHCWIMNDQSDKLKFSAEVHEPKSGRLMKVFTTEPAMQFYSGNFLDASHSGREGVPFEYRYALCLETQHYPDSPNHPEFPSTRLDPGSIYKSTTVYKFLCK